MGEANPGGYQTVLFVQAKFRSAPPGCNDVWTNMGSGPITGDRSVRVDLGTSNDHITECLPSVVHDFS